MSISVQNSPLNISYHNSESEREDLNNCDSDKADTAKYIICP